MNLKRLARICLLALLMPLQACGIYYSADPIEAWVVDAETNEPLAGVNVVAHWALEGGLEGGNIVGQVMVMEAVTDHNGRFYLPAWGPKATPIGLSVWDQNAKLKDLAPKMLFFKSGYKYKTAANGLYGPTSSSTDSSHRTSDWNGKTIKMENFTGSLKEYASNLQTLSSDLEDVTIRKDDYCAWKRIPKMVVALGQQSKIFQAAGMGRVTFYDGLLSPVEQEFLVGKGCGSTAQVIREYEK